MPITTHSVIKETARVGTTNDINSKKISYQGYLIQTPRMVVFDISSDQYVVSFLNSHNLICYERMQCSRTGCWQYKGNKDTSH